MLLAPLASLCLQVFTSTDDIADDLDFKKFALGSPSLSHPVNLFKVMFGDPTVGTLDRERVGLLFREQEPRQPLQEVHVGNCTLLLAD